MKKELKIWYCSDNDFYYVSYDGKEIALITNIKSLLISKLDGTTNPIFISKTNSITIPVGVEKLYIIQGDGVDPDNIMISLGDDVYYLQITGDQPYAEYLGQKKTRLFDHKIWMEF